MYRFLMLLVLVFFAARTNAKYHPHLLCKRYIIIPNKTVSVIFIGQSSHWSRGAMNTKANRNKLTYSGITIYGLLLLLCVFSVAMALFPDIPCNAYILNSKFMYGAGDTLNQQLSVVFAEALLYSSVVFYLINTLKIEIENTDAKRFVFAIYCFIIAVGSFLAIERIWVAIAAILEAMPKA